MKSSARLASIDLIRGAAMILMALDHVRVYSGLPAGGPTPGIFFTRWITHYCAPAFIFFAGTSSFFYNQKHADLTRFLLTRGLWLIFLELTVIKAAWTFNLDFVRFELAGVIWVIGWCMILMAGLTKLPTWCMGAIGGAMIAGHNLMDPHFSALVQWLPQSGMAWLWKLLYVGFFAGPIQFGAGGPKLFVLYSLVPWIGVMATGYVFGQILMLEAKLRNRVCLWVGLGAIALFLVLRGLNLYGDPRPWTMGPIGSNALSSQPPVLQFLNVSKYPASFLYLLMTLGPIIALIPVFERMQGRLAQWMSVFGRVPFFYYLLHIPLIHLLAILASRIRMGGVSSWLFNANHPMDPPPPPGGYVWNLGLLYLVWAVAVVLLYYACRWYVAVKARSSAWWLRYL